MSAPATRSTRRARSGRARAGRITANWSAAIVLPPRLVRHHLYRAERNLRRPAAVIISPTAPVAASMRLRLGEGGALRSMSPDQSGTRANPKTISAINNTRRATSSSSRAKSERGSPRTSAANCGAIWIHFARSIALLPISRPDGRDGVAASLPRRCVFVWTRPELVEQIRFVEWTAEGRLRHAAYLGLPADKAASSVHREF
jgi:hypothetical protein